MAEENAKSGEMLKARGRTRAAASRFYYAAYQAAHSLLLTTPLAKSLPARGNWDHAPLANAIREGALKHLGFDEPGSEQLRSRLSAAMHARAAADYGAGLEYDQESLEDAQKAATRWRTGREAIVENSDDVKQNVTQAVATVRRELASDLDLYQFVMFPDELQESFGGWILPAECRGSGAMNKSYDLHRLVERVEHRLRDLSDQTITIDLLAARTRPSRN